MSPSRVRDPQQKARDTGAAERTTFSFHLLAAMPTAGLRSGPAGREVRQKRSLTKQPCAHGRYYLVVDSDNRQLQTMQREKTGQRGSLSARTVLGYMYQKLDSFHKKSRGRLCRAGAYTQGSHAVPGSTQLPTFPSSLSGFHPHRLKMVVLILGASSVFQEGRQGRGNWQGHVPVSPAVFIRKTTALGKLDPIEFCLHIIGQSKL